MDVSARAADDVWAISNLGTDGPISATISHWDGSRWSVVRSPRFTIGSHERLRILSIGPDDVWAVLNRENSHAKLRAVVERYDGRSWRLVPVPFIQVVDYGHLGIAGAAPEDIWVVGTRVPPSSYGRTFTLHWDGSAWGLLPSPNPGSQANVLEDAAVVPGGSVWAVGEYGTPFGNDSFSIRRDG
jgi:hypothetical protein